MLEPFAVQVYLRFLKGESVAHMAVKLGIPADRLERRIRAARLYLERRRRRAA